MELKDLTQGDRILFRDPANRDALTEGNFSETSPSGKFVCFGYGQWHRADNIDIVEKLAPHEETVGFVAPEKPAPLQVIAVNTEPIATTSVKTTKPKPEPEPVAEVATATEPAPADTGGAPEPGQN